MDILRGTRIRSTSIQPDDWDAMDEDVQFSERDKHTPAAASNHLSLSSVADSPTSSELSHETDEDPCEEYREKLEHSIKIRDLKMALRHLFHMIAEQEEFGDIFERESCRRARLFLTSSVPSLVVSKSTVC